MEVRTTRFGKLELDPGDVLRFPSGLLGLATCREWVLLVDPHHEAVSWLQSVTRPEVALAVVSPRRFLPNFQIRIPQSELQPLALTRVEEAHVLTVLGRNEAGQFTMNLKAPLVLNVDQRLGRQIITSSDFGVAHPLPSLGIHSLRQSA